MTRTMKGDRWRPMISQSFWFCPRLIPRPLTQRTIISWDLAFRTSTLECQPADPAHVVLVVLVIVVIVMILVRRGARKVVQLVGLGRGVPFPGRDGVVGRDGEFHGDGEGFERELAVSLVRERGRAGWVDPGRADPAAARLDVLCEEVVARRVSSQTASQRQTATSVLVDVGGR
jgi:hypothetical protein